MAGTSYFLMSMALNIAFVSPLAVGAFWGGKPERLVAVNMLIGEILTLTVNMSLKDNAQMVHMNLVLDLYLTLVMGYLVLRYDRLWLLFAFSGQFLELMLEVGQSLDLSISRFVYITLSDAAEVYILGALVGGTVFEAGRARKRMASGAPQGL